MNGKHKVKHKTRRIKEHITVRHGILKHMTHHMREQDEVKRMAHSMKEHSTGGHDNAKHITNRMVESIPNRQTKILQDTQDKKPLSGWTLHHKAYDTSNKENNQHEQGK